LSDPQPLDCQQLTNRFAEDGYCFPVQVMSQADALAHRHELESLERVMGNRLGNKPSSTTRT